MRKRGGKGVGEGAHRPLAPSCLNRGGRESLLPGTAAQLRLLGTPVGQRPDPFAFSPGPLERRAAREGAAFPERSARGSGRRFPRPGPSGQAGRGGPRSAGETGQGRPGCREKSGIDFNADNP